MLQGLSWEFTMLGLIIETFLFGNGVVAAIGISNDPSFRQKHLGVPDGSKCSDGTSYPLMENYTLPVAEATGRVAHIPPSLCGDI